MIHPDNRGVLQWVSEKKTPLKSRVDLHLVSRLVIGGIETPRLKRLKKSIKNPNYCLALLINQREVALELIFESHDSMKLFVSGL